MSIIQYAVNGAGIKSADYLDPREVDESTDDWENHDGWEDHWPLNIELFVDGKSVGLFEVVMEMEPTFSASKQERTA